jgi:hypothetical protein
VYNSLKAQTTQPNPLTPMDKTQAAALHNDLLAAISTVLAKHGMDKSKSAIKYTADGEVTFTLNAATPTAKENNLERWAEYMGIPAAKITSKFSVGDKMLKLVDFNHRAPKMPWVAEDILTGKRYKLSKEAVKARFVGTAAA